MFNANCTNTQPRLNINLTYTSITLPFWGHIVIGHTNLCCFESSVYSEFFFYPIICFGSISPSGSSFMKKRNNY